MGCYYTLCHNTYAYSLLFYKVYIKRENAGSWNSGLEKEQILETYSAQLQKSWNSTKVIFGNNKKYWKKNLHQGGLHLSTRVGGAPPASWAPWSSTDLNSNSIYSRSGRKKIREKDSSRFMIRSRSHLLFFLGRADLESVWGSGEGDLRSSSSPTLLHRQFHDAPHREWVIPS